MKQIIEKLASLERDIASEKVSSLALLLREDADDKWDLPASAPWLEANNRESLEISSTGCVRGSTRRNCFRSP